MTQREESVAFQALVLSGICIIIRLLVMPTSAGRHAGSAWRANAIGHMDVIGQQSDGSPCV